MSIVSRPTSFLVGGLLKIRATILVAFRRFFNPHEMTKIVNKMSKS